MTKKVSLIIIALVMIFFQSMFFIKGQLEISNTENRMLALFPHFSAADFFNGSFQEELESALKDQIFQRDTMIDYVNIFNGNLRKNYNVIQDFLTGKSNTPTLAENSTSSVQEDTTQEESNTSQTDIPQPTDVQSSDNEPQLTMPQGSEVSPQPTAVTTPVGESQPTSTQNSEVIPRPTTNKKPDNTLAAKSTPRPTAASGSTQSILNIPFDKLPKSLVEGWLEPIGSIYRINKTDFLTDYPYLSNSSMKKKFFTKAKQIDEMAKRHPDVKIYVYYATKSEDLNWFNKSEGTQAFDYAGYLFSNLSENIRYARLEVPDLETYTKWFYKTDHHCTYQGGHQMYVDIYNMLIKDFKLSPLKLPNRVEDFGGEIAWYGSKAKSGNAELSMDGFAVYEYDLGAYDCWYGDENTDIVQHERYLAGDYGKDQYTYQYNDYFGREMELTTTIFPENPYNLMIIGDSNVRPYRKVLGSHFGSTYFFDHRVMKDYDLDDFIEKHDINAVIFLGQYSVWHENMLPNYPT